MDRQRGGDNVGEMSKEFSSLRWIVAVVVVGALAYVAYRTVVITNSDPRPPGNVYDVMALRERDDLNVLFILVDTLRAHRLSAYGYERETSPMFDYLAEAGLLFRRHTAQSSWTKASMASLWTGLYPVRTGVLESLHGIPEEATMPAEIFREAGFRTAGIWRNGWVDPSFGFGKGFEVYARPAFHVRGGRFRRENPHVTLEGTDYDVAEGAREFLRIHGDERWFLYLHMMDVHQYLYSDDSALFGSEYSDVYDNSIHHTDRVIGELLTDMAEQGLLEKTLIVWTSDHGEAFNERGYEGHAQTVYRETTDVPFLISFPFQLEPRLVVESTTAGVDVWPTVLDLLGLPALPDTDGRSRRPEILAAGGHGLAPEPGSVFAHIEQGWGHLSKKKTRPMVTVVDGSYRFVSAVKPDGELAEELFDSNADPAELENVLDDEKEVADAMRALLEGYHESRPAPWGDANEIEIDELELNHLRALGYKID